MRELLAKNEKLHMRRVRRIFDAREGCKAVVDGKPVIDFANNDYLNLSTHNAVKKSFANSAYEYGLGSTGSALISGYSKSHAKLEKAFAEFLQRDRAILFNSGFHANLGVLTTFAGKDSVIIADKYCHASLNAGAMLSRAKFIRYKHNDLQHAEELLQKYQGHNRLLVTESVFSMQGSISNIKLLSEIANRNSAMLIVDDAHGIGVLGKCGAGAAEHFQKSQQALPCLVTPLGKALGSYGAIVTGDDVTIESLLQFAGSYRYCTALPPAVCEATFTALSILKTETWRRQKLLHNCEFFLQQAQLRGIRLASNDTTPIKSVVIGDNEKTLDIQRILFDQGFHVSCIRPPTVPKNMACMRISLNCMHEEGEIIQLLDLIDAAGVGWVERSPAQPNDQLLGCAEERSTQPTLTEFLSRGSLAEKRSGRQFQPTSIVFLPGFGFKASIFENIAKEFPNHNVILADLTEDINDLNNRLPADCILIAWSLGGVIATDLCLKYPSKYKKLITITSTPKFLAENDWPGINKNDFSAFYQLAESNPPELLQHFAKLINGKNKNSLFRQLLQSHLADQPDVLLSHLDLLSQSDLRTSLGQLKLPVLQIFGDEDYFVPENCAHILKSKHPHHAIKIIPGAGHIPFITHMPEFMQYVRDFIS